MSILTLIVILAVIGLIMYLINRFIPMQPMFKNIFNIAVAVLVILWLLKVFGLFTGLQGVKIYTMNPYILISIGGLAGIWLHVFVTMQTINKNTPQADFKMVWYQYWKTDYLSFIVALLAFVIYVFCLSEWINMNNLESPDRKEGVAENILHGRVAAFIKTFSVVLGYFADYIVYKFIGKTKKIIDKRFEDDEKP